VIAGPDEGFMKELHNLVNKTGIENQAILTGPMNSAEKLALLHDTDVFVTPKFSGFPITFLEACVCGVPIVTTNYGDNLDWINDNCGYVVNPNPKEISYAIQAIISNECNQLIKSEKNRQKIKARFSWDHIILRFEKIYEDNRKRG
jgi:glycosyltransferase involved in cell wall biosynthesis